MASNSYHARSTRIAIALADWCTEEEKARYFLWLEYAQYLGAAQREHRPYLKSFDKWLLLEKKVTDFDTYISDRVLLYRACEGLHES